MDNKRKRLERAYQQRDRLEAQAEAFDAAYQLHLLKLDHLLRPAKPQRQPTPAQRRNGRVLLWVIAGFGVVTLWPMLLTVGGLVAIAAAIAGVLWALAAGYAHVAELLRGQK